MRDLFMSECRRFRNSALIFAAIHVALQLFVSRLSDILQMRWEQQLVALALYLASGFGFALYQFGTYRQPSRWLWLLHRPMPRAAIFGAITLASTALILFAVGLPALLTVLGKAFFGELTVDTRHYLLVVHVVLFTLAAWLAGAYVVLSRSRFAAVILLLPWLMLAHLASGWAMLVPALLCVAILAYLVYTVFKPNRLGPPETGVALAANAIPLQLGFYFAMLWAGSVTYQYGQMVANVHPLNRAVPPAGAFIEQTRSTGRESFLRGLKESNDPRAAQWRRQVALLDVADIEPAGRQYPVRDQVANQDMLHLEEPAQHIEWTFSHDAMRFRGRDMYTNEHRGWIGVRGMGDKTPFAGIPVLVKQGFMTPQQFYAINPNTLQQHQLIGLKAPETLSGATKEIGGRLYALTNHRLIAYDKPVDADAMLVERFSVALPGPFSDLDRIDIARLLDGTLLSFNAGRQMIQGASDSAQTVMFVDDAGNAQVVARRALAHDFSPLFEHKEFWLSPLLQAIVALPDLLLDKGFILDKGLTAYSNPLQRTRPAPVLAAALICTLLAACAAWLWLRPVAISARRKAIWIAASLLVGLPAIPSLMLLQPRPPRPLRKPIDIAAPAAA